MPTISNFPFGFQYGVSIRGIPLVVSHPGQVFWVSNSTVLSVNARAGSNGNDGSYQSPFATIAYALTRCVASRGDIIMVKPGHAEAISEAAGLALSVAGVALVGLGHGSLRPTLTLDTA